MKKNITDLWSEWKAGKLKPNGCQLKVLELWSEFLAEHPRNFDEMVREIPDMLIRLWEIASKS